jgi:hypothetical protein
MSGGRFVDFLYKALGSSGRLTALGALPSRSTGFDHALNALPVNALAVSDPFGVPMYASLPEDRM